MYGNLKGFSNSNNKTFLETISGVLSVAKQGFGFVKKEGGDVFVPQKFLRGAISGDTVLVNTYKEMDGRVSGEIDRIVDRGMTQAVGTVQAAYGKYTLDVTGKNNGHAIVLMNAVPADAGQVVQAIVRRWPEGGLDQNLYADIVLRMGEAGEPYTDVPAICAEFGLNMEFPKAVMDAAELVPEEISQVDLAGRTDMRDIPFITIDGITAKDFDDAVYLEKTPTGWHLKVAIADVAHYVKHDEPLDAEAKKRGTSTYFPGICIPMLPERLSNGICSLKPNVDRLVMYVTIDFDKNGEPGNVHVGEGVIHSKRRMTYDAVADILDGFLEEEAWLVKMLLHMNDCRQVLYDARIARGAIDLDMEGSEIVLGGEGIIESFSRSVRNAAHRLIEEFMLASNEAVARFLAKDTKSALLLRIHEAPNRERVEELALFASGAGLEVKTGSAKSSAKILAEIIDKAEGHVAERSIYMMVLTSMKQACYSASEASCGSEHFGLATSHYTHFTSPIRRYPDLLIHRMVKAVLHGQKCYLTDKAILTIEAAGASQRERVSVNAERAMFKRLSARYLETRKEEIFDGVIASVGAFGCFIELTSVPIEGLVNRESLEDFYGDTVDYQRETKTLKLETKNIEFKIGMPVKVQVENVSVQKRQIDFRLIA